MSGGLKGVLVGLLLVVVLVAGIVKLREATQTVHTRMPAASRLDVQAHARWRDGAQGARHRTWALTVGCVSETKSSARVQRFGWSPDGDYHFTVRPALDRPDRRQLSGCLGDLRVPQLLVEVDAMQVRGGAT